VTPTQIKNQIKIKRAGFSDASVISLLGKKTFTETFGDIFGAAELIEYLDKTFKISKLQTSLLKDENIFGILYYLDQPVGYYKIKLSEHFDIRQIRIACSYKRYMCSGIICI